MMYKKVSILLAMIAVMLTSCTKNNNGGQECNQNIICYTSPPSTLFVVLRISPSPDGTPVKIRMYEGNVDNGVLFDSFETMALEETYILPVNQRYSAEAEYSDGEITIIAVDGDRLNRESFENCDQTCYDWDHSITLDLELN
jgi:hypothetical protein